MCTASFSHGSTPMRGHPLNKFPPAPEPFRRLRRFSLAGNLPQGKQKFLTEGLTTVFACCIVSYTSNEPLNHVWKGGEHLPPTLNEQTSIYLQIAKMLEDGILRGIYPEDTQVPSTNELARTLCINPATAAKAPRAAEKIRAKRKQTFFEQYVRPLAAEAKNIGITPAELQAMLAQASEKE